MKKAILLPLAVLTLAVFLFTACGDNGDKGDPGGEPPPPPDGKITFSGFITIPASGEIPVSGEAAKRIAKINICVHSSDWSWQENVTINSPQAVSAWQIKRNPLSAYTKINIRVSFFESGNDDWFFDNEYVEMTAKDQNLSEINIDASNLSLARLSGTVEIGRMLASRDRDDFDVKNVIVGVRSAAGAVTLPINNQADRDSKDFSLLIPDTYREIKFDIVAFDGAVWGDNVNVEGFWEEIRDIVDGSSTSGFRLTFVTLKGSLTAGFHSLSDVTDMWVWTNGYNGYHNLGYSYPTVDGGAWDTWDGYWEITDIPFSREFEVTIIVMKRVHLNAFQPLGWTTATVTGTSNPQTILPITLDGSMAF